MLAEKDPIVRPPPLLSPRPQPVWLEHFSELACITDPAWLTTANQAQVAEIPAGMVVFHQGDACANYLLVTEGFARVQQVSSTGRAIMLYRVGRGQACILTVSGLLSGNRYTAEAVTETELTAVVIPRAAFMAALGGSPQFQQFVFNGFSEKLNLVLTKFEQVAFGCMEVRLARHLLEQGGELGCLRTTHEQLANDLGTDRVVISRLLKDFEHRGYLSLGRSRITVRDQHKLENYLKNNHL